MFAGRCIKHVQSCLLVKKRIKWLLFILPVVGGELPDYSGWWRNAKCYQPNVVLKT